MERDSQAACPLTVFSRHVLSYSRVYSKKFLLPFHGLEQALNAVPGNRAHGLVSCGALNAWALGRPSGYHGTKTGRTVSSPISTHRRSRYQASLAAGPNNSIYAAPMENLSRRK